MKRIISAILILVFALSFSTSVFAADGQAPYSLKYLKNIEGVEYKQYRQLDDSISEKYIVSQKTLEMYDAIDLWIKQGTSWSATVQLFRDAFLRKR